VIGDNVMSKGYFREVRERFGTEFWVNNPSGPGMRKALEMGAVGVASNPCYVRALLKSEEDYVHKIIDEALKQDSAEDNDKVAMRVIRKSVERPLKVFHPLYESSQGRYGYAAIQGNPLRNDDLGHMLEEAESLHEIGENIIIKFPATIEGAKAIEEYTARGWATIGTMCFSVSQYIYLAEAHRRGLKRADKKPRCLITMLPGLLDEYLAEHATLHGIEVSPEVMRHMGITTARAAHKVYQERNYEAIILSGGARSTLHWTELVGPDIAMTLGRNIDVILNERNPEIVNRLEESAPAEAIEELRHKFPDFAMACDVDALAPEEFPSYYPVAKFQNAFLDCFGLLVKEIQSRRQYLVPS